MKISKQYPDKFAPSSIARHFVENIDHDTKYSTTLKKGNTSYEIENFERFCFMLDEAINTHEHLDYTVMCIHSKTSIIDSISSYKQTYGYTTNINISADDRDALESFINKFEMLSKSEWADRPAAEPAQSSIARPRVFIGHGGSNQWADLKSHLQDQHGIDVVAFETGARAGHTIRDIVKDMSATSDFALLVMTGEDEHKDGTLAPRLNVVHEAGIFQGILGFERAIILLENGTTEFSNISGIQQIRFNKGNIRETYGDVLATLRREKLLIA